MAHPSITRTLSAAFWVTIAFTSGWLLGGGLIFQARADAQDPYSSLRLLAQVMRTIEVNYIDNLSSEQLIHGAINGMVDELDEHSHYLPPDAYANLQSTAVGWSIGVGIELNTDYIIVGIKRGSPSAVGGLLVGDRIVQVDGNIIENQSLKVIQTYFEGELGTQVDLEVERDGQRISLTLQRESIIDEHANCTNLPNNIVLLTISEFGRGVTEQAKVCLKEQTQQRSIRGIILDLRTNPGGLVDEGISLADLFIQEGIITTFYERGTETNEEYIASPNALYSTDPMVVLINGETASAAELVAGALQKLERAPLIGTPSYGKGSMQKVYAFDGKAAIKLTVAHYRLPDGSTVTRQDPINPDHNVASRLDSPKAELKIALQSLPIEDAVKSMLLQRLDLLKESTLPAPVSQHQHPQTRLDADLQLQYAWNLLNSQP